jgi:hypothetical protein
MADRRVQFERTMRLTAVQEQRHGDNRHVGQNQRNDRVTPPRQVDYAGEKHPAH